MTTDMCERFDEAICEGRFFEDPGFWRSHILSCPSCRRTAEGAFDLQDHFEKLAINAPVAEPDPEESLRVINAVFERYARRQARRRWGLAGGVAGVVVVAALLLGLRAPTPTPGAVDPAVRAQSLRERVFPPGGAPRYDLLARDPALRDEYVAALDDPSPLVRRTALRALTASGIDLEPERLERILGHWEEALESPVLVAEAGAGGRRAEAAEASANAMLLTVLRGAQVQVSRGGKPLRHDALLPFLRYADAGVRQETVYLLRRDPTYVAGADLVLLLASDPSPGVRQAIAECLLERGGAAGARAVVDRLRSCRDDAVESWVASRIGETPDGLRLARERLADPSTASGTWLAHAWALARRGERDLPSAGLDGAIARADPSSLAGLAMLCQTLGRHDRRATLQERWRQTTPPEARLALGMALVQWDLAVATEAASRSALEILAADADERLLPLLRRLAASDIPSIRDAAASLLERRSR